MMRRIKHADVEQRMPKFRPAIPPARVEYLEQWIRAGAPDDAPAGRDGVSLEPEPRTEPTGPPTGPLSFATDIVGLFRPFDREEMLDYFDLFVFEDVRDHAEDIRDKVAAEEMPCDAPWPPERVAVFQRWIDEGRQP